MASGARHARHGDGGDARRTPSLSARLALAIVLVLGAGGVAVTVATFVHGSRTAQETYDRLLLGAADQIAASASVLDGRVVVDIPLSAFELLALARADRVFYRVVGANDETLTGYDELALPETGDAPAATFHEARFRGEPIRLVALPRRFAERAFGGTITVLVAHTLHARETLAREIAGGIAPSATFAGLGMALLAVYAVYSALRPLRRIERGFAGRDPRDLTPLEVTMPRELRPVVDAINRFMARLERQVSLNDNFIADSAHQLRTPVAALRAQAELAAEESDPRALRAALVRIHERSRALSRLTDQLLNRALVIHRADSATWTAVDLRTVAMLTADEFDLGHADAAAALRLALPERAVRVHGDELSLCEASKNLVSNAFAHGLPPVTLEVSGEDGAATLTVRDHGPGIALRSRRVVGERFARNVNGSGLGLAIVREVARAHGGELRVDETEAEGFGIALVLPRVSA